MKPNKGLECTCRYGELLKEIRLGNVKQVLYFDNDEVAMNVEDYQEIEGPCLVVFNDDRVAHSYVPRFDYRIPCASTLLPWACRNMLLLGLKPYLCMFSSAAAMILLHACLSSAMLYN